MCPIEPLNECIYCGKRNVKLTKEHVIPYALMGKEVIPKASCVDCQEITKKFEQRITRSMYWPMRAKYGFPSRHNDMPAAFSVELHMPDGSVCSESIPAAEHPNFYIALNLPEPGLIAGREPSPLNPEIQVELKGDLSAIERIKKQTGALQVLPNCLAYWGDLCKQVAKIAHCAVTYRYRNIGYEALLPPLIIGKSEHLSHYVGGVSRSNNGYTSRYTIELQEIHGEIYITVVVLLLLIDSLPPYRAIAGKVTDIDAFMAIAAAAQSG